MTMVAGFAIGLGWTYANRGSVFTFILGFGLAHPWSRGWIWTGVRWAAPIAWSGTKVLASDALFLSRAAMGTRTAAAIGTGAQTVALGAAAVGAGYTIGAVVGTSIISKAEKEGIAYTGATADVLDFYLLKGGGSETSRERSAWYESDKPILNIPGDVSFIAKHYWNKWT